MYFSEPDGVLHPDGGVPAVHEEQAQSALEHTHANIPFPRQTLKTMH